MYTGIQSVRTILPLVLALALVGAACSKKEEPAPEPAAAPAGEPQAPAGSGAAKDDDWSWADQPATKPAEPSRTAEYDAPRSIEPPPPQAEQPRPAPRRESPAPKPTNRLSKPDPEEPEPEREREPEPVKVTYSAPAGTQATFRFNQEISSETALVGDRVVAILAADVTDGQGHVVLPAGTKLSGTVTEAVSARKVKKKSSLAFALTSAELPDGSIVPVNIGERTEGKGWTKKQGAIIGGSAAGGALLGQILGGDTKSTAAGAVVGGAVASGVIMSKKGEEVAIPSGQDITLPLEQAVRVERIERAMPVATSG